MSSKGSKADQRRLKKRACRTGNIPVPLNIGDNHRAPIGRMSDQEDKILISQPPPRREWTVWLAVLVAIGLRLATLLITNPAVDSSIEGGYITGAATLASGHGLKMHTTAALENKHGFETLFTAADYMKQRQAQGGRVDPKHPYPKDLHGWLPATVHPAGYSVLLYIAYLIGNYDGMIFLAWMVQIGLDALACMLIFLFARNVFDRRVGLLAAWLYAFCPATIFLSLSLLPDAFHGFFASLILCLASFARPHRGWWLLLSGAAVGLACHFRSEYLLWPIVMFLILLTNWRRLWSTTTWTVGMVATMLIILLPWALWTRATVGRLQLGGVGAWTVMYLCIGEDTQNPWGIVMNEVWVGQDAERRGFASHLTSDANQEYRRLCKEYITQFPSRYAKCVLFHRLPLVLATPYLTGTRSTMDEFSFTKYHVEEGLTRWGVLQKYPGQVLKYMWPQLIMLTISGVLSLSLIGVVTVRWRHWRQSAWLLLPWSYTVSTISLLKSIEPRNMAPTLIVQCVALAVVIVLILNRRRKSVDSGWSAQIAGAS